MTVSRSYSESFTRTSARHVASKVAADLRFMKALYGSPSDEWIQKYLDELVELLAGRYVKTVTYGFKRDDNWIAAVRYVADLAGNLTADDRAGGLPYDANVSGLTATSYLDYSQAWFDLTSAQRAAVEATLPFKRVGAAEPGVAGGYWEQDHTYSANGGGVRRSTLRRYGS
jgi:hypothetical protein